MLWAKSTPYPSSPSPVYMLRIRVSTAVWSSRGLLPRKTQRMLATSFPLPTPGAWGREPVMFHFHPYPPSQHFTMVSLLNDHRGVGWRPQPLWEQR